MANPLSVQLYTVRDVLAQDRDGVLRQIAQAGYDAVEPFQPTEDPEGLRKILDDLGLTVSGVHARQVLTEEADEVFAAAKVLGTDLVIIPVGLPMEEFSTRQGLQRMAERINEISARAAGHGLRLGYHNHEWELAAIVEGRHGLEVLADLLAPEVFLEVDTYWAAVGGADVPALLRRLSKRVLALHVKDGPLVRGEPNVAVGRGLMPVPEVLAAAPEALRVVEMDACATDIVQALAESRTYLAELEQS
jgi:sugar phosphate isomerase/epimerase